MNTPKRRRGLIALAVTLSLAVAACGSDDDSGSDEPSAPAATDAPDTTDVPDTTEADDTDGTDTTDAPDTTDAGDLSGGEDHSLSIPEEVGPADESLDPVVIGVINMDEGVPSYPDISVGIDAAAALVNAELGGIQGRPVEIRHCNVGVDQTTNQKCAQDFANDGDVNVVINGYVFGSGYIFPIMEASNLPTLIQTPLTQPDFNATLGWAYQGGNAGGTAGTAAYAAKFLDAQDIVIIGSDNDALRAAVQTIEGLPSVEGRNISVTYVSETASDITADVQVSGALEADAILALINGAQCPQVAQTLKDLGAEAPIISTATCAIPSSIAANPELFAGWYVVGSGLPPLLPEGESPELDYFVEKFPQYGPEASLRSFQALGGFGAMLAAQRIGNDLPDTLSRDDWATGLAGFTGPYFGGRAELSCPGPHFPAVCDNEVRAFVLTDDGLMTQVEGFFDGLS